MSRNVVDEEINDSVRARDDRRLRSSAITRRTRVRRTDRRTDRAPVLVPSKLDVVLAALLAFVVGSGAWAQDEDAALAEQLQSFQAKIQAGDLAGAITDLEQLRERPDAPLQLGAILGGLYTETGQPEKALELLAPLADADDADPAVLFNAGRAAKALRQPQKAEAYLQRAVRLAPNSPAARELGLLWGLAGRFEDAYALLYPWAQAHPEDEEARLAATLNALQLERAPEAEELLSDLPQENPGVRLLWGRLLMLKGDPWGAIGYLQPLVQGARGAMASDVSKTLAEAYLTVGDSASAIDVLQEGANDPEIALLRARALHQNSRVDDALAALEPFATTILSDREKAAQALERSLLGGIALEYGRLLTTSGETSAALDHLELAIVALPTNKIAWQAYGQALASEGRRDEAQEALQRFQQLSAAEDVPIEQTERDLNDPTGRELRAAMALLGQGRGDEALARLRREARLHPEDPRPPLFEARALLELERAADALALGEAILEAAPESADARYIVGAAQMALGRLNDAEIRLRQAIQANPNHTAAMSDLAVLLVDQGKGQEARALLDRVLALRPDDPLARSTLERIDGP